MRGLSFLGFVLLTVIFWGIYGPVLHVGQYGMGADGKPSSLRPFICVGIAYFLIAVIVPLAVLTLRGEKGKWSVTGFMWSFGAGAVGAVGALGIILAFKFNAKPVYVMPLVFGCAPVVNTIVTMTMNRTIRKASPWFYLGIVVVAIGAAGVMFFKPAPPKHSQETTAAAAASNESEAVDAGKQNDQKIANYTMIALSIALTAFCWGAYGPVLHHGQTKMDGSRLRPFLCVGLAYFAIAVILPILLQGVFPREPGGWSATGTFWSLLAGAAGAIGALGIIYAFNFGGKPIFVMPLVFGGAPVVNTFTTIWKDGSFSEVQIPFYISLLLVIFGAVTVLVCSPKPGKPPGKMVSPASS